MTLKHLSNAALNKVLTNVSLTWANKSCAHTKN